MSKCNSDRGNAFATQYTMSPAEADATCFNWSAGQRKVGTGSTTLHHTTNHQIPERPRFCFGSPAADFRVLSRSAGEPTDARCNLQAFDQNLTAPPPPEGSHSDINACADQGPCDNDDPAATFSESR